jgi:hypothetical protein
MLALAAIPRIHVLCGNYAAANAQTDELVALAEEKGALFWKAPAMMERGWVSALTGKPAEAVQMITSGHTAFRLTGGTAYMSLSHLARAHAELGHVDDAWRCIGEAMTAIETTKERWCESEVNRIAGKIALLSPEPDAAKAEAYFERALAVAARSRQNPGNFAPQ